MSSSSSLLKFKSDLSLPHLKFCDAPQLSGEPGPYPLDCCVTPHVVCTIPPSLSPLLTCVTRRGSIFQAKEFGAWKKVKVLVAQSCTTLCDPMDRSPPGSSVLGIGAWKPWAKIRPSFIIFDSVKLYRLVNISEPPFPSL